MSKIRFIGLVVASFFLLAQTAWAQDDTVMTNAEHNVSWSRPEGWTVVDGNDRAVFNIKHDDSQSQIELIATELMSAEVASVFYETFHETLTQSSFSELNSAEEQIGGHQGELTNYTFEYAGVTLRVVVFEFIHDSTAYLIVGYIKDDEFDNHIGSYRDAITSITFGG